jgi:hypothetical protein
MPSAFPYPCPSCGKTLRLTPEYLAEYGGQTTSCFACGNDFVLPTPEQSADLASPCPAAAQVLPYASLQRPTGPTEDLWADGMVLVLANSKVQLPCRCVKCNAPAEAPIDVKLVWSPDVRTGIGMLTEVMRVLNAQRVVVRFWFCPAHASRYRFTSSIGLGVILAGLSLAVAGIIGCFAVHVLTGDHGCIVIFVGILVGILGWVLKSEGFGKMKALRIDFKSVKIYVFGATFMRSLPSLAAARQTLAEQSAHKLFDMKE